MLAASGEVGLTLVATELVLLELADALCEPEHQDKVLAQYDLVATGPTF